MKRVAALLTVFNRRDITLKCLKGLSNQVYNCKEINVEVFLTNDGCTDGTPEAVKEFFPDVHIINGDGSLFWNRGMIAAWKEASMYDYDYYLWLNDDTYLYSDAIARLLNKSGYYEDKSIIVGSTCSVENKDLITYGGWVNNRKVTDISKSTKCNTMNGNIVLIPRKVYKVLGYNDPYYRHAMGDLDYGFTATRKGISIYTGEGIFGECNLHEHPTIWMDPSQPLKKRWKNFMSPIGNNPIEFFYFKKKNYGLFLACVTFLTNWIHFILPWLWPGQYKNNVNL